MDARVWPSTAPRRIAAIAALVVASSASGGVLYVDGDSPVAPAAQTGEAWATAFSSLDRALAEAAEDPGPNVIRIAAGTYHPDDDGSGDRTATFQVPNRTIVEGGYAGHGAPDPDARDAALWPTTLDGTLAAGFDGAIAVYHVVSVDFGFEVPEDFRLDGLVIRGGLADGACPDPGAPGCHSIGGGLVMHGVLDATEPLVRDCIFIDNEALSLGGAIAITGGTKPIVSCRFEANRSGQAGGAMAYWDASDPIVLNCRFVGNEVASDSSNHGGGAIYSTALSATIANCLFDSNHAVHGAAIWCRIPIPGFDINIVNCTFVRHGGGAAIYERIGAFCDNVRVTNSIFWQNDVDCSSLGMRLDHCARDGGWTGPGSGTIDVDDPGFVDAANGDFSLWLGSPCLDTGDGDAETSVIPRDVWDLDGDGDGGPETTQPLPDLDRRSRVRGPGCRIDIGAFEVPAPGADSCDGDVDGDAEIGFGDLLAILTTWGSCAGCDGDIDGDGSIDFQDVLAVISGWGACGCPHGSGGPT